jgi:cyanoexosortase A
MEKWLGAAGLGLCFIHLVLVYRHRSTAQLGIAVLAWWAAAVLLCRRRRDLKFDSGWVATLVGLAVLAVALLNACLYTSHRGGFIDLYPLLAAAGLGLLASGFTGLKQYWRELLLFFFLGIPHGFLIEVVDLAPTTAKSAGFLLWYCGMEVRVTGLDIALPGGMVTVNYNCDGMGAITYLLCLSVMFLLLFPTQRADKVLAPLLAMGLAFLVNAVRVALLAVIKAEGGEETFNFWHQGHGSLLWTVLPVLLFGLYGYWLLRRSQPKNP